MEEPRKDMLPDESEKTSEVTKDVKKEEKPQEQKPKSISPPPAEEDAPVEEKPEKGSKTPKDEVYKALRRERQLRKEAQAQLKELEASSAPEYEEEDDRVAKLEAQVKDLAEGKEVDQVVSSNPALAAKADEFAEFRDNNPHLSPQEAKAVFLDEQGVSSEKPQGLEKPTSGPKEPPTSGFTPEQIEDIRIKEPRRYERMVQEGKFDKVDWGKEEGSFGG